MKIVNFYCLFSLSWLLHRKTFEYQPIINEIFNFRNLKRSLSPEFSDSWFIHMYLLLSGQLSDLSRVGSGEYTDCCSGPVDNA